MPLAIAAVTIPAAASVTVLVSPTGAPTPRGAYIRADIQNCANPTVTRVGQTIPRSRTFPLNGAASVSITLEDNVSQISCNGNQLSYYTFTYVVNGVETVVKSSMLPAGTFALANLANLTSPPTSSGIVVGPPGPPTNVICAAGCTAINDGFGNITLTITGGGGGSTQVAAPLFSVAPGTYPSPLSVAISQAVGGVTRYTTNGSTPTSASPVYSTPLSLTANTTLKAYTTLAGFVDSVITSAIYTVTNTTPTGPAHMELASTGQNANMNGAMPFIGSHIYDDVSSFQVDIENNPYVQTAIGNAHLDVSQPTGQNTEIPYYVINSKTDPDVYWLPVQTEREVNFPGEYDTESDHTLVPLKHGMRGEGDVDITSCRVQGEGDNHGVIMDINPDHPTLYEGYNMRACNGVVQVYSLTVRDLNHPFETQGPKGRTASDVAGMVILPTVAGVRYEDYANGAWKHAARWTLKLASKAPNGYGTLYTGMGLHGACGSPNCSDGRATMFGQRMRLKASYNCVTAPSGAAWSAQAVITCQGLKKYGVINADNGINMAVQGTYDSRWGDPGELNQIAGTDFETIIDPSQPKAYAAQVPDEGPTGGTSQVIDQSGIYNYSGGAGPIVPNNPPRPTIVSFTPSAMSVQVGQPITFSYTATNATVGYIDNAGGSGWGNSASITWTPNDTASYKLTVLGQNGWTIGDPITVTVTGPAAPQPTSNTASGTYTSPQTVSLATPLQGGQIRYTTDGSTPGYSSPIYSGSITVANNGANTIKAVTTGVAQGYKISPVTTINITLNLPAAAAPSVTPAPGTYSGATTLTATTTTSGAGIYYTTDGSTPTASSTFYSGPIALPYTAGVQTRTNFMAATIKYGFASSYFAGLYLIGTQGPLTGFPATEYTAAPITYTAAKFGQGLVGGSTVDTPKGFSPLNSADGYTIDAWVKTTSTSIQQIIGNGDDSCNGFAILARFGKFMACGVGGAETDSGIFINDAQPHYVKATFSTAGVKTFVDGAAGAATTAVPGVVPAGNVGLGWVPGRGFLWDSAGWMDSVRIRTGVDNSLTVPTSAPTGSEPNTFAYWPFDGNLTDATVRASTPVAATPTFSPAAGTYTSTQTITVSSATSNAQLYCTTDGSAPTTSSPACASTYTANTANSPFTLKAIASANGYSNSPVAAATYVINSTPASPTLIGYNTNDGGTFNGPATATRTMTGGNYGVVVWAAKNRNDLPTVTCNGNAITAIAQRASANEYIDIAAYALPSSGGGNVSCTTPNGNLTIVEFSGVTGYEGVVSANTGTDPVIDCGSVTTTGTNRLALAIAMYDGSPTTPAAGYSTVFNNTGADNIAMFSKPIATASTNTVTAEGGTTGYNKACIALAVK